MEGLFRLLLVAGLLAMVLPAVAATFGPQPGAPCEPTLLATQVALFCAPDMPTAQCCEPVVAAVDLGGGVPCLCRVAAEPQLAMAGLNATHLLTLYTSCGGLRPGGAHLAADCEGPAPPAAVVSAPPPLPGPRRKQPAHAAPAPPPPPSTEKPSPRPQAHSKAVSAYAAASPLAPAAAYEGPAPPAAVVRAPPPSPGPRRKQPAHAAPFSPPSTEKPSPPPQQHDGAAHSKTVPAYAATSPLALAPAPAAWEEPLHSIPKERQSETHLPSNFSSCPGAAPLSTAVAADCGSRLSEESCCSILRQAIQSSKPLLCLCALSSTDAIDDVALTIRDLVTAYASCVSIRPSDLHLPSTGCAQFLDTSHPTQDTRLAPPPTVNIGSSPPHSATRTPDHWLLVAILVLLIFVGVFLMVGTTAYYCKQGDFGWMRMGVARAEENQNQQDEDRLTNNQHDAPPEMELAQVVDQIVDLADRVRRYSPRLAGETPLPGLGG